MQKLQQIFATACGPCWNCYSWFICYFFYTFVIAVLFKSFLPKSRKQFASQFLLVCSILDISAIVSGQLQVTFIGHKLCATTKFNPSFAMALLHDFRLRWTICKLSNNLSSFSRMLIRDYNISIKLKIYCHYWMSLSLVCKNLYWPHKN